MTPRTAGLPGNPALTRLNRLAPLAEEDRAALRAAEGAKTNVPARREMLRVGDPVRRPTILLAGWAGRVRDLSDGRRQILDFVVPGELIGVCHHANARALASVTSLTPLTTCPAPRAAPETALRSAYAISAAYGENAMLRQITRLGRLNAVERTADLLLDLHDRLLLGGIAGPNTFPLPLTQETLADALGLTSVHINRTLQTLRRDGLLVLTGGTATLPNRHALERLVDYRPVVTTVETE